MATIENEDKTVPIENVSSERPQTADEIWASFTKKDVRYKRAFQYAVVFAVFTTLVHINQTGGLSAESVVSVRLVVLVLMWAPFYFICALVWITAGLLGQFPQRK